MFYRLTYPALIPVYISACTIVHSHKHSVLFNVLLFCGFYFGFCGCLAPSDCLAACSPAILIILRRFLI